jgi:hypothetical protein
MAEDEIGVNSHLLKEWGGEWGESDTTYSWITTAEARTPNVLLEYKASERYIHPRLYFSYVKNKMNILEFGNFKRRMKYLEKLTDEFAKNGQQALSEDCIKKFIVLSRESAMYACGIKLFVTRDILDKFKDKIKVPIKYTDIKNFARVIPVGPAKKIRFCIEKKLFDSYLIIHVDNKESTKETEKERIVREKDPICFGRIDNSDKYYFICDWVDELDNLRLETIVKALKLDKTKMRMKKGISEKDFKKDKK